MCDATISAFKWLLSCDSSAMRISTVAKLHSAVTRYARVFRTPCGCDGRASSYGSTCRQSRWFLST